MAGRDAPDDGEQEGHERPQISRTIGVTYKTAWFLCHRIRESLREPSPAPLGGEGDVVEADETYVGGKDTNRHKSQQGQEVRRRRQEKEPVVALVERGGRVRSLHVPNVTSANLREILARRSPPPRTS